MFQIDLSKKNDPVTNQDFTLIQGLKVTMRPLDTISYRLANNVAQREFMKIYSEFTDKLAAGEDVAHLRNMDEKTVRTDVLSGLITVAFAVQGIISWNAVDQDTGEDVPPTAENINWIFGNDFTLAESLYQHYVQPFDNRLLVKNSSAPALTGTSAAGRNIAKAAGKTKPPVRKGKKAKTAKSALTGKTKSKPVKA